MTEIQQDIINALNTQLIAMSDVCELLAYSTSVENNMNDVTDFALAGGHTEGVSRYRGEMRRIHNLKINLETKWGD